MHNELYQVAYKDIEEKEIDEALWLKAMSHAMGDKTKAKWTYIELRVDQLLRDPSPAQRQQEGPQAKSSIRSLYDVD